MVSLNPLEFKSNYSATSNNTLFLNTTGPLRLIGRNFTNSHRSLTMFGTFNSQFIKSKKIKLA